MEFCVGFDRELNASFKLYTIPGGHQPNPPDLTEPIHQGKTIHHGSVAHWRRAAIFSAGNNGSARFFEIEPADGKTATIPFHGFYVRGDFTVVQKLNNPKAAREAWEALLRGRGA